MRTLIIKLGATGDVVRTTPILRHLKGDVIWITESKNKELLHGIRPGLNCASWEEKDNLPFGKFDYVINLEDTLEIGSFVRDLRPNELYGAYADSKGVLSYTENARPWFDLSLISRFGRPEADRLKFVNRLTYQELVFEGLGFRFAGESYLLPQPVPTDLRGDVAIAPEAGPVWPMKNWAYYPQLKQRLEARGLTVNILPRRSSFLEHLSDVRNHRCLVSGDSLPMHFGLGGGTPCVTLFTCTSPWEIYGYGCQQKIVSPLLGEFFYKRGYDQRATSAISLDEVFDKTMAALTHEV